MFALQWISVAAKPVVQAAGVKVIFASLTGDVLLDMLVAALFTCSAIRASPSCCWWRRSRRCT